MILINEILLFDQDCLTWQEERFLGRGKNKIRAICRIIRIFYKLDRLPFLGFKRIIDQLPPKLEDMQFCCFSLAEDMNFVSGMGGGDYFTFHIKGLPCIYFFAGGFISDQDSRDLVTIFPEPDPGADNRGEPAN